MQENSLYGARFKSYAGGKGIAKKCAYRLPYDRSSSDTLITQCCLEGHYVEESYNSCEYHTPPEPTELTCLIQIYITQKYVTV